MKKYCECFQAGIPCGDACKCEGCQNCVENPRRLQALAAAGKRARSVQSTPQTGSGAMAPGTSVDWVHPAGPQASGSTTIVSRRSSMEDAQSEKTAVTQGTGAVGAAVRATVAALSMDHRGDPQHPASAADKPGQNNGGQVRVVIVVDCMIIVVNNHTSQMQCLVESALCLFPKSSMRLPFPSSTSSHHILPMPSFGQHDWDRTNPMQR